MEQKIKLIKKFYAQHQRMPSYAELMKIYKWRSKNSVYKFIKKLVAENILHQDRQGRLVPTKNFWGIKLLGMVEAGFPSPAEEELADVLTLDDYLIDNREATFMLRVTGDSMIDAGIMPGDIVLVDRSRNPRVGDIVIAEVDQAWTIKYFRKESHKIFLQAANKKYQDIYPQDDLKIAAVVTSVIRKY